MNRITGSLLCGLAVLALRAPAQAEEFTGRLKAVEDNFMNIVGLKLEAKEAEPIDLVISDKQLKKILEEYSGSLVRFEGTRMPDSIRVRSLLQVFRTYKGLLEAITADAGTLKLSKRTVQLKSDGPNSKRALAAIHKVVKPGTKASLTVSGWYARDSKTLFPRSFRWALADGKKKVWVHGLDDAGKRAMVRQGSKRTWVDVDELATPKHRLFAQDATKMLADEGLRFSHSVDSGGDSSSVVGFKDKHGQPISMRRGKAFDAVRAIAKTMLRLNGFVFREARGKQVAEIRIRLPQGTEELDAHVVFDDAQLLRLRGATWGSGWAPPSEGVGAWVLQANSTLAIGLPAKVLAAEERAFAKRPGRTILHAILGAEKKGGWKGHTVKRTSMNGLAVLILAKDPAAAAKRLQVLEGGEAVGSGVAGAVLKAPIK